MLLGAQTSGTYKPCPEAYLRSVDQLGCVPGEVMLVAAHNSDLAAADGVGLQTAFVAARPNTVRVSRPTTVRTATGLWSLTTSSTSRPCSGADPHLAAVI